MRKTLILLTLGLQLDAAEPPLTFNNQPMGTLDRPLVLRTYVPDPGIDDAVFPQHDRGRPVAKYNPGIGQDVKGEIQPVAGIAGAIAVNFGPALSYVFDTTECRLLYAWQGGFLDMTPYWGEPDKGSRISFDYIPRLSGTLFWQASGKHPVEIGGKSITDLGPRVFTGYHLEKGVPVFEYRVGEQHFTFTLKPSDQPLSFAATLTGGENTALAYHGIDGAAGKGSVTFTVTGSQLGKFQGYKRVNNIAKASAEVGEKLFNQYGCAACHSTDGSASHGPSLGGLAGHPVEIEGLATAVTADRAYLLESIKAPNAKIVKGYPPNYMPPFGLPDVEYDSLVLYIETLGSPE
ncbi:c-type cytochrome [Luteolibacter marinus]|uniref:c-type cytochrome n=1 Tax=Luteolibacter marinus TaxID=2776705 RepID=UPI0018673F87|nr:cytochrome c [Luteolibacter marinus]